MSDDGLRMSGMTLYAQRMAPIWERIKSENLPVSENNLLSKNTRRGEFLIKSCNKGHCLIGIGYVHHSSMIGSGWTTWGTRKNAAWFSKEEAVEIIKNWRGVKIVKK